MPNRQEPDPNGKMISFLNNDLPVIVGSSINCHTLGRITFYDSSRHRANVQPLPLKSTGQVRAILINCIVPASLYLVDEKDSLNLLHVGSVVLVGFLDRDADNWHGSQPFKLASYRLHSIQDAIIESVVEN